MPSISVGTSNTNKQQTIEQNDSDSNCYVLDKSQYKRCLAILEKTTQNQPEIKEVVIDKLFEVLHSKNKHIEANELANCKTE